MLPELLRRGVRPDCVTDQTSAHDPANGYLPAGWSLADWEERRERDPAAVAKEAKKSMAGTSCSALSCAVGSAELHWIGSCRTSIITFSFSPVLTGNAGVRCALSSKSEG